MELDNVAIIVKLAITNFKLLLIKELCFRTSLRDKIYTEK